jgi:hypothetical protein
MFRASDIFNKMPDSASSLKAIASSRINPQRAYQA